MQPRKRTSALRVTTRSKTEQAASRYGAPKQRLLLPAVLERLRKSSVSRIVVVEYFPPRTVLVTPM